MSEIAIAADKNTPSGQTQNQPAPQYDPTAGSIVNGLRGVGSAGQASLNSYRDDARSRKIQDALALAIASAAEAAAKDGKKSEPIASPIELTLSEVVILCNVREEYARAKAYADYITALTAAFDQIATPAQINSLGDAITSLFNKYTLNVTDNGTSAPPGSTQDACIADLKAWANDYYGKTSASEATADARGISGGIDKLFDGLKDVSAIVGAVINIITPIADYTAETIDKNQRQTFVDENLADPMPVAVPNGAMAANKKIETALKEALVLVTVANGLADRSRHVALGQFMEKLQALRETPIDLSKLATGKTPCAEALQTYAGESANVGIVNSAGTPLGSTTLYFEALPEWIDTSVDVKGFKNIAGSNVNDAFPEGTKVSAVHGPTVVMSKGAKSAIGKGTAIRLTSASDDKETKEFQTSGPTKAGEDTLHFEAVLSWPSWVAQGTKIAAKVDEIAADTTVESVTRTIDINSAAKANIPAAGEIQFAFKTASNGYISCFAQASKQISQAASDVVKAAGSYDTAAQAQASSAALVTKINSITAATKKALPWPASGSSQWAQDAAELAAFGAAMQNAFSSDKITALQNALDGAKK
jgi:hypothetical protein